MLLLIQNGLVTPCVTKYLKEEYEIIRSYETDVSGINLERYSTIIILGGYQSVIDIDNYPYLLNVIKLIKKCLEINKSLFGICLGSQLIAHALGCEIKSSQKLNIGYDAEVLGYKNIFRSHIDYIIPNDSISVMEYFEEMPYLYKRGISVYGIQCHPDIVPECIHKYNNHYKSHDYAIKNNDLINQNNKTIMNQILEKLSKKN